jgi:hypothetical protein
VEIIRHLKAICHLSITSSAHACVRCASATTSGPPRAACQQPLHGSDPLPRRHTSRPSTSRSRALAPDPARPERTTSTTSYGAATRVHNDLPDGPHRAGAVGEVIAGGLGTARQNADPDGAMAVPVTSPARPLPHTIRRAVRRAWNRSACPASHRWHGRHAAVGQTAALMSAVLDSLGEGSTCR